MNRRTVPDAPQSAGIGHADEIQTDGEDRAVGHVHKQLQEQVARDPVTASSMARVVALIRPWPMSRMSRLRKSSR